MEININCDLGEKSKHHSNKYDPDLLEIVNSANVACGFHAGDDKSMSVTYVTTDWTNKPEVKKPRIVKPKPSVPLATATTQPTPSVEPTTTTTPEEPKTTELPQPKTQTKPEKVVSKPEPTQTEPETTEPKTQELPQPKQTEKPVANPEEDEENKNLQESIKNIKRLMFS